MNAFIPEDSKRVNVKSGPRRAVLIDDDPLIAMGWEMRAKRCGVLLRVFADIVSCRSCLAEVAKTTPLFIDSELGGDVRGEEFAQELYALGYREIYLVTGHPPSSFPELPHIKGVFDKTPPEWLFHD